MTMSDEQLNNVRDHIAACRKSGAMTPGTIYARDLLAEVEALRAQVGRMRDAMAVERALTEQVAAERDQLRQVLAALTEPSPELVQTAATAWRDARVEAGALFGDKPVKPTGSIVSLVGEILRPGLPAILNHLEGSTS